jgi:hypothetical protein
VLAGGFFMLGGRDSAPAPSPGVSVAPSAPAVTTPADDTLVFGDEPIADPLVAPAGDVPAPEAGGETVEFGN